MTVLGKIQATLADILDVDAENIGTETYLFRDLDVESIDLLELAVSLSSEFNIDVNDDEVFLKTLRVYLSEPGDHITDTRAYLMEKYPYLTASRVDEILADQEGGPVLKVKDIADYVTWRSDAA
ncbi:acyl carrier protein [Desulfoluna spongiiphila]|uniref:Acyl carrier protein n=1 Tax=Desulfoluna spongiiphila TaxID=419481 RepID=A0A1G5AXX8_9BACT|nr:acyl carrier protein [Desulfoluna spongiiphila]SCX82680.1 acyl carrier protein [Desulfoluna spongiiphila]VVS92071.1 phosphopantetheine binding acp domain [Desulfoluna spongiiphila]